MQITCIRQPPKSRIISNEFAKKIIFISIKLNKQNKNANQLSENKIKTIVNRVYNFRYFGLFLISLVKNATAQCFAVPELSTSFGSHEMINFQSDIGSLALRIATDIIENSASMPSCIETDNYCTASLGTCIDSGSLVRPDMLDHYRDHFGGLIAVDFTYAAGHCSFLTHTMNVETKAVCEKFLITLASQLGLSSNLSFHDDQNSRLVISENELTFIEISAQLEDPAFCTFNSRLITRVILEHELMAKLIRS